MASWLVTGANRGIGLAGLHRIQPAGALGFGLRRRRLRNGG
jgi:NAD(P)-dependent dehydrogenase (short-subunit alcohol dehydrogenase family)